MTKLDDYITTLSPKERRLYARDIAEAQELEDQLQESKHALERVCQSYDTSARELSKALAYLHEVACAALSATQRAKTVLEEKKMREELAKYDFDTNH